MCCDRQQQEPERHHTEPEAAHHRPPRSECVRLLRRNGVYNQLSGGGHVAYDPGSRALNVTDSRQATVRKTPDFFAYWPLPNKSTCLYYARLQSGRRQRQSGGKANLSSAMSE